MGILGTRGGGVSVTINLRSMHFEATNLVTLILIFDCGTMGRVITLLMSVCPSGRGDNEVP